MTNQEMETLLLETLRRSGSPAAPEALLEPLEDPDQGAAAIERLLSTGRVAHRASRMETPRSSSSAARPICR